MPDTRLLLDGSDLEPLLAQAKEMGGKVVKVERVRKGMGRFATLRYEVTVEASGLAAETAQGQALVAGGGTRALTAGPSGAAQGGESGPVGLAALLAAAEGEDATEGFEASGQDAEVINLPVRSQGGAGGSGGSGAGAEGAAEEPETRTPMSKEELEVMIAAARTSFAHAGQGVAKPLPVQEDAGAPATGGAASEAAAPSVAVAPAAAAAQPASAPASEKDGARPWTPARLSAEDVQVRRHPSRAQAAQEAAQAAAPVEQDAPVQPEAQVPSVEAQVPAPVADQNEAAPAAPAYPSRMAARRARQAAENQNTDHSAPQGAEQYGESMITEYPQVEAEKVDAAENAAHSGFAEDVEPGDADVQPAHHEHDHAAHDHAAHDHAAHDHAAHDHAEPAGHDEPSAPSWELGGQAPQSLRQESAAPEVSAAFVAAEEREEQPAAESEDEAPAAQHEQPAAEHQQHEPEQHQAEAPREQAPRATFTPENPWTGMSVAGSAAEAPAAQVSSAFQAAPAAQPAAPAAQHSAPAAPGVQVQGFGFEMPTSADVTAVVPAHFAFAARAAAQQAAQAVIASQFAFAGQPAPQAAPAQAAPAAQASSEFAFAAGGSAPSAQAGAQASPQAERSAQGPAPVRSRRTGLTQDTGWHHWRELGVPRRMLPAERDADDAEALVHLVRELPTAPSLDVERGDVVILTGDAALLPRSFETLQRRTDGELAALTVGEVQGLPVAAHAVSDAEDAARFIDAQDADAILVLVVGPTFRRRDRRVAAEVIEELRSAAPDTIWVALDARRRLEEWEDLLDTLPARNPDLLLAFNLDGAQRPGDLLTLDVPVAALDGVRATRGAWAGLLEDAVRR